MALGETFEVGEMDMEQAVELYNGKPLAEQVADHIVNYIVGNELEAGAKLPNEFELAERIGVGRSTIREAIKILVSRNIVEIRRGAGTFVSEQQGMVEDPLGLAFVKDKTNLAMDLLSVRLMLEPEIARMAAEHATKEQVEELISQCDKVEELIRKGQSHMEEDIVLHRMIASCSGNVVVEKLVPVINSSIAVFVNITSGKLRQETIETHREIVDAIARGDGDGAKCSMNMHLLYNRRAIQKIHEQDMPEHSADSF